MTSLKANDPEPYLGSLEVYRRKSNFPRWDYFETEAAAAANRIEERSSGLGSNASVTEYIDSPDCTTKNVALRRKYHDRDTCDTSNRNNIGFLLRRKSSILHNLSQQRRPSCNASNMTTTNCNEKAGQRRAVLQLAKHLRCHCDKILDSSIPFVIDSSLLWSVSEAINSIMLSNPSTTDENSEESKFQDYVMFLSDFFEQTPSLCISLASEDVNSIPGNMDLTFFRNLQFLELRKIPPLMVSGINSVKTNLRRLKCSRCLDSLSEILTESYSSHQHSEANSATQIPFINLTCVWPELREIDFSFNRISDITAAAKSFELTPSVEMLNLSRNKISKIDDSFAKVMNSLSVLNLNYNQLTIIPPFPPNLKVLLLAHNYITNLNSQSFSIGNLRNLELLDLSTNMISDENDLIPLKQLCSLKNLSLIGNPISYLDSYRATVSANLSRLVLNRVFVLDKKKLSNSEVRLAVEQMKQPRFIPYVPANSITSMTSSLNSSSITMTTSSSSRFSQLKSMTQSYDSNSSSVRSSCRKKPKIREIVLLDMDETPSAAVDDDVEVITPLKAPKKDDEEQHKLSRSNSNVSEKSEIIVIETRQAIATLRAKYGEENWLLRQAGCAVGKLLGIPDRPSNLHSGYLLSKSLPPASSKDSASFYYDCQTNNNGDKLTDAELSFLSSGKSIGTKPQSYLEESTNTNSESAAMTNQSLDACDNANEKSSESSDGLVFYSCTTAELSESGAKGKGETGSNGGGSSIFDFETETPDIFSDSSGNSEQFRIFQSGQCFKLIILYNYLYEIDPEDSVILNKWDLKSLKMLQEEHCDSETESVEFRLSFDTMRKQHREKSIVMSAKDFSRFDKLVSPFIEERTLQEFADAFQCIKCKAQFSKAMANKIVKQERGQIPVEVPICPNPGCLSDLLVPLDAIPLPNNEVLSIGGKEFSLREPLRCSTPLSGHILSVSIPKQCGRSPRHLDPIKPHASSLTSRPNNTNNSCSGNNFNSNDAIPVTTASSSEKSSLTVLNTRSDSDIEVLSCDSSSIEVLAKISGDSGSDIEVHEAVEIEVPELQLRACKSLVMTESTSSGSYADSICTAYERKSVSILPISQQFSPTSSLTIASSASYSSQVSTSTLTPTSIHSPNRTFSTPIRYDYKNFNRVDHRLQLYFEISISKSPDEKLLALTKVLVISESSTFLSVVIFSNRKIYLYKIVGIESDQPRDWLQKVNAVSISKLVKLDVLIGRHGVGLDLSGKYYAILFRDSERTSNFLEFFMSNICEVIERPPMVRDFSQTQKALMSPKNPLSYFGILRFVICDIDKSYAVSAIVLTDEELILVTDLMWMAVRCEIVNAKHARQLSTLRQVECLESDLTFVRLIFETEKILIWELSFETEAERNVFVAVLKTQTKDIPFVFLSQPLEA